MVAPDFRFRGLIDPRLEVNLPHRLNLRLPFGRRPHRHIHSVHKRKPLVRGVFHAFIDPGEQPGLLVVHDVAADCLAEHRAVPESVQIVVSHLERQPERISIFVDFLAG